MRIIEFLQSHPTTAVLAAAAAMVAVAGGVYRSVEVCIRLYRRLFLSQVSSRQIVLHAEWGETILMRNDVRSGETLEGVYESGADLRLSLRNTGRVDVDELTVEITGNAKFSGTPSSFFDDGLSPEPAYMPSYIWHSVPGVRLQGRAVERALGRFRWDRKKGLYYARLVVSARHMRGNAEFSVALKPQPQKQA